MQYPPPSHAYKWDHLYFEDGGRMWVTRKRRKRGKERERERKRERERERERKSEEIYGPQKKSKIMTNNS